MQSAWCLDRSQVVFQEANRALYVDQSRCPHRVDQIEVEAVIGLKVFRRADFKDLSIIK